MKKIAIIFSVALLCFTFLGQITHEVHANNTNSASISDGNWYGDGTYKQCPTGNIYYDTTTTHNGSPTWRVEPDTSNWQNNPGHAPNTGPDEWSSHPVNPGDHVIMSCWIKTSGDTTINGVGARIGFDVGDNNYRIVGVQSQIDASTGIGDYHDSNYNVNAEYANFVSWGHDWTYVVWNFTVPSAYESDGGTYNAQWNYVGYPEGTWHTPTHISPWCQVLSPNYPTDTCTAWFSDFQLYINPSGSPQTEQTSARAVSVAKTGPINTQTLISTSSTAVSVNSAILINIKVNATDGSIPQGTVIWSTNSSTGTFTPSGKITTLDANGMASITFSDNSSGNINITAAYTGNDNPNTQTINLTVCFIDFNHDGAVNFLDIMTFVNSYIAYYQNIDHNQNKPQNPLCDLNGDGVLNFNDITLFVHSYTTCHS